MSNIIQIIENEPVVSAMTISENTDNVYESIRDLILQYKNELKQFGDVAVLKSATSIDSLGRKNKSKEVAMLNEQQSTFLITLLKNTPIVVRFKLSLVKEFYELRTKLSGDLSPELNYQAGKVAHVIHKNKESYFLDAALMKEMRHTLGLKTTREFYCNLLDIEVEDIDNQVLDHDEDIKQFIKICVEKDLNSYTRREELYDAYLQWTKDNGISKIYKEFKFMRKYNLITETKSEQKRFGQERFRCYNIRLI